MITRRVFLGIAVVLPISAKARAVFIVDDGKKTTPKTVKLFVLHKELHKLGFVEQENQNILVQAIKDHLRKFGMTKKDLKSLDVPEFLQSEVDNFNNIVADHVHENKFEIIRPRDERETCPVFSLETSPEIIKEKQLFIKFGYPFVLVSENRREIDMSSIGLIKYAEELGKVEIERDALYIKFTKPDRDDPKKREDRFLLLPLDVPVYIIKDKKLYFIDIDNPKENPEKVRSKKFA